VEALPRPLVMASPNVNGPRPTRKVPDVRANPVRASDHDGNRHGRQRRDGVRRDVPHWTVAGVGTVPTVLGMQVAAPVGLALIASPSRLDSLTAIATDG
jgi:hypothetical protein